MSSSITNVPVNVSLKLHHGKGTDHVELKISQLEGPKNVTNFARACASAIETKQRSLDEDQGRAFFRTLVVRVDMPQNVGRFILDKAMRTLCKSTIYWDTLKIITPFHSIINSADNTLKIRHAMQDGKKGRLKHARAHLSGTQLVYEGAGVNVPWPWYELDQLSGFQIRSLQLEQQISDAQCASLLKHAVSGTVDLAMGSQLKLRIWGLTKSEPNPAVVGDEHEPKSTPQRLLTLNLGRLEPGVFLRDIVGRSRARNSIVKLAVDVSKSLEATGPAEVENIASLDEAIRACEKLGTVKVRCKAEHAEELQSTLKWGMKFVPDGQILPNDERELMAFKMPHECNPTTSKSNSEDSPVHGVPICSEYETEDKDLSR